VVVAADGAGRVGLLCFAIYVDGAHPGARIVGDHEVGPLAGWEGRVRDRVGGAVVGYLDRSAIHPQAQVAGVVVDRYRSRAGAAFYPGAHAERTEIEVVALGHSQRPVGTVGEGQ